MKTAAICIATYRRSEGLERLLASLASLRVPKGWKAEIRVVDNDPEGPTLEVLRAITSAAPDAVLIHEPRRNIAHARNAALDAGAADAFLFIDDDEVPASGWLVALLGRLERGNADAAFGPVVGRPVEGTPAWLVRGGAFDKPGPDHDGPLTWTQTRTSSTAVLGEWFNNAGFRFDPAYGKSGGSDVDLFQRMEAAGARLAHCRRGLVYEDIEPDRCTPRAVLRRRYRAGVVLGKLERGRTALHRHASGCKRIAHGAVLACLGLVPLAAGRPGLAFHGICRAAVGLGAWRGCSQSYTVVRYPERATQTGIARCA